MYKLENNVEWTDDLKNAFKHGMTKGKIVCEGTTYDENNHLVSISIEDDRYVPDLGFIGQATSRKATINLVDIEQNINLENKVIDIYIGAVYNNTTYYINYGKFIVNEPPENDDTNGGIKIVAYDYMLKFNKDINEELITFPCTLLQLTTNICLQAGVELGNSNFPNKNFIVENNQYKGKQLRDMLKGICQCAFSWARIGQDNKLYIDFNATGNIDETITLDEYKQDSFKKANEYYGPVNKVTYADSDIQGQEKSVENASSIATYGLTELIIYDNFFAYTETKREELIQAGTKLFNLKYMPIQELEMVGLIYLDCTDIIGVIDSNNDTITTRVFNHRIDYKGYVEDSIENEAVSETQRRYNNKNSNVKANTRTEIIVDKANNQIQSIASEIGDRSEKTTTITQDLDRIESQVSQTVNFLDEKEGTSPIKTEEASPYPIYALEIKGRLTYNNYFYCNDYYCGDNYAKG